MIELALTILGGLFVLFCVVFTILFIGSCMRERIDGPLRAPTGPGTNPP